MSDDNRFASTDALVQGQEVWAWARGACRRVRVVNAGRSWVDVAFRLVGLGVSAEGAVRIQRLKLERLRRAAPPRGAVRIPPPTMDQIRGVL